MTTVHRLTVAEVINETAEACSIVFELEPEQRIDFAYQPGQFLTLRVPSDQCGSVARCYSLSSSPHDGGPSPLDRSCQIASLFELASATPF